jgi:transposase-like protein
MVKVKKLLDNPELFERERTPTDLKLLGVAIYVQTLSVRKTAKILSEIYPVSHTAVWKWVKKLEEKIRISTEKKHRKLVEIDDVSIRLNSGEYHIYTAIDVEKNEIFLMRVYPTRDTLTTKLFLAEVLRFCKKEPKFIVDRSSSLVKALKSLGLRYEYR